MPCARSMACCSESPAVSMPSAAEGSVVSEREGSEALHVVCNGTSSRIVFR